jgi:pimeloyl-ACP methyl ester carboxylesterase
LYEEETVAQAQIQDETQRSAGTRGDEARRRLLAELPVSERRMELAGISTAVLEGGEGPPVVLLHGPMANATHWMRVIPGLVTDHRVIVPDLPGHGDSIVIGNRRIGVTRVMEWLAGLIAETCKEAPFLAGQALGGAIAARFASGGDGRLRGLALVDSFGLAPLALPPAFELALTGFLAEPTQRSHEALWQHCAFDLGELRRRMGEQWRPFEAYNVDRARAPGVQASVGALIEQFGMAAIAVEDLARIAVPTTVIWGRHDKATPLAVAEQACARYGWPLHVIEDCNDDPPVEQPEALIRALRAALGRA